MAKGPEKNIGPKRPEYRPGVLNAIQRKILMLTALIAGALAAASGCDLNRTKTYPDPDKMEQCYDPNFRNQFPFHERMEIALAIHYVLNDQGTTPMNFDALQEDIDELRRAYGSFVQDFYVTSLDYYQDSTILPEYSPSNETQQEYKDRFKEFASMTTVDGAVDIYYVPSPIAVGESGLAGFHMYSGNEDLVVLFTDSEGKTYTKQTITHEMGHYFGLEHGNNPPDRLESTFDIAADCSTPQYITYLDGDKCMVACTDGSNATEANVMDYFTCSPIDDLEPLHVFTTEQLQFANCVSATVKPQNVNQDLPRNDTF